MTRWRKDRAGKRKERAKHPFRTPDLGYYILITDAEATEKYYFIGLRDSLAKDLQQRLVIKVIAKSDVGDLIDRCEEAIAKHPQYAIPWLIIDRDEVKDFDALIANVKRRQINAGWSNPCIELWFQCYFENPAMGQDSGQCCSRVKELLSKKAKIEYDKADEKIYRLLCKYGDEQLAITRAKKRFDTSMKNREKTTPSALLCCTTLYQLVEEIVGKARLCV